MFEDLMNERLTLHKKSTGQMHPFAALVQPGKSLIITGDGRLPVEEGDLVERPLPTSVETYTVIERGYYADTDGIHAHYQMKVRKNSAAPGQTHQAGPVTHIYNLTGNQARVNVQSTDSSVNISSVTNEELFAGIAEEIQRHVPNEPQRNQMLAKLEALRRADATSMGERYREFISTAADHMTLLTPFLPALAALLLR